MCMCVFLYTCVHILCICEGTCPGVCMWARGWHWMSSSVTSTLLKLELTDWARACACPGVTDAHCHSGLYVGTVDPYSGPHAYMASTLPTAISLAPGIESLFWTVADSIEPSNFSKCSTSLNSFSKTVVLLSILVKWCFPWPFFPFFFFLRGVSL